MTRVLVVDDHPDNLYYLQALLEGNGFTVDLARNGAEAFDQARKAPPDMIVCDLLMPVMDGYTLLRLWKADERLRRAPFVVYTATYTEPEDKQLALRLGADAFILKPAEPDALLATLREVLVDAASSGAMPPRGRLQDEEDPLEAYSRVLVRKLEQKMLQLEEANRALREDVIERTRAREQLEQSTALQRIAGTAARLGGWALLLPERVLRWSDETCSIHDLPPGHVPALDEAIDCYAPEYRDAVRRRVEECVADGTPYDFESELITAAGRRIWVRTVGEAVRDERGAIVRVQGALQDISDRKQLEQRLLRAQRMESIAALTGGMAHDLNNVLQPILLSATMLKEEVRDPELLETIATLESCALRGAEMVRQVLTFARRSEEPRGTVDVAEVLAELGRVVRDTFPPTIDLRTEIAPNLWRLVGDSTQVHQVFMNLLVNARDAMPNGGRITIAADNAMTDGSQAVTTGEVMPGPHVRISVVDTGLGMPPDLLSRIFDPLFTTKSQGKGTGLGLSTVAAIVRNHRGFVTVRSEVGVGTAFQLHFPAVRGSQPGAGGRAENWQGNGELILVVDDEAAVRSLAQQTLEAFGYRVVTATDGADAVAVFARYGSEISLVLSDVAMPVMDGPAMMEAIRKVAPRVPIIATSGTGSQDGEARSAAAGAGHFLVKPYTADTLLAAIHGALRDSVHKVGG